MKGNQVNEIEQLIDSISKVDFIRGRRQSNQYVFPIMRILRHEGFKVRTEYLTRYPEGYIYQNGYIDLYAKKENMIICVEIDYKTVKRASVMKISQIWKAIPVFVLTYEGIPNIQESLERIDLPHFFLIDLYNHIVYSEKDKV